MINLSRKSWHLNIKSHLTSLKNEYQATIIIATFNLILFQGVITAGVSVPVQIGSQESGLGTNYWPRLQ